MTVMRQLTVEKMAWFLWDIAARIAGGGFLFSGRVQAAWDGLSDGV
jgi:hypothetical protein